MYKRIPFYTKITIALLMFTLIASTIIVLVTVWSNREYHNEVTQKLNEDLANYIIDHQEPLFDENGLVRKQVLKDTAMHTMMINPLVEVYLLDNQGKILGHALHTDDVILDRVDLGPVDLALNKDFSGPIYGTDPRLPDMLCIFSVAPVMHLGRQNGYLYVVLSSQMEQSLAAQLGSSYVLQTALAAILALLLVLFVGMVLAFRVITLPLKRLTNQARTFFSESQAMQESSSELPADEIKALEVSFNTMQQRIQSHFNEIQQSERLRRELISNISHDLRTPLASIQGYIETVLLKINQLKIEDKKKYLTISLKHCNRLGKLISALFELSKLESRSVSLEKQPFSLNELINDILLEFAIRAEKKNVQLKFDQPRESIMVEGDLGMIERVFQNLIDNALRYTPIGGEVKISLKLESDKVFVSLEDSGQGIQKEELPYIFDRYYRSANDTAEKHQTGTGLGLAIVKRILELHDCTINVKSQPQSGACFEFPLPLAHG